jgi:ABC-type glycerol-3-phosphate transport system substrate-binding protein
MKMKKLAGLILICAVMLLMLGITGCGDNDNGAENQPGAEGEGNIENSETVSAADVLQEIIDAYELPEMDFSGVDFNVLVHRNGSVWDSYEIFAEEITGELLNDAVYTRNSEIEEKYNVTINSIGAEWFGGMFGRVRTMVNAGDDTFDMVMLNFEDASRAAKTGLLMDLNEVPHIDLSKPT